MLESTRKWVVSMLVAVVCVLAASQVKAATVDLLVTSFFAQVEQFNGTTGAHVGRFADGLFRPSSVIQGPGPNNYVFIGDQEGVYRYEKEDGTPLGLFSDTAARVVDIAFGPDGNMYTALAQGATSFIHKWDGSTGAHIGTFATLPFDSLQSIMFGLTDGNLYASGGDFGVVKFDKTTGANLGTFVGVLGSNGIAEGPDGHLYVVYAGDTPRIARYHGTTGAVLNDPYISLSSNPQRITFDAAGNLYVSKFSPNSVEKYNSAGAFQGVFASGNGIDGAIDIAFFFPEPGVLTLLTLGLAGGLMRRSRS